jgi:caa(3)-type oxidase subunit IV
MNEKPSHLTGYLTYAVVVVVLFLLTTLSVFSTGYHLGALTVGLALLIAAVKVATVLTYFMHLFSMVWLSSLPFSTISSGKTG